MVNFNNIKTVNTINNDIVHAMYDNCVIELFNNVHVHPQFENLISSNPYEITETDTNKLIYNEDIPDVLENVMVRFGDNYVRDSINIKIYSCEHNGVYTYHVKYRAAFAYNEHVYYNIILEFVDNVCNIKLRKETGMMCDFSLAGAIANYLLDNKFIKSVKFKTFEGTSEDSISTFCLFDSFLDVTKCLKYLDNNTEIFFDTHNVPKKLINALKRKNIVYYFK